MRPFILLSTFIVSYICFGAAGARAQAGVSYLDENHHPATEEDYFYKRTVKYKRDIINPNFGIGYKGNITTNPTPTGLHVCTVIDYYRTGEVALIYDALSLELSCTDLAADGPAISYYRNGRIHQKGSYVAGKPQGWVITYDEAGGVEKKELYQNGKRIEENKFPVAPNMPLIGTWVCKQYYPQYYKNIQPQIKSVTTAVFYGNSWLEITSKSGVTSKTEYTNWRYIPTGGYSGTLEQYQGDDLLYRGDVRWISMDQFEYTNTFHQDPSRIGQKLTYTRQ